MQQYKLSSPVNVVTPQLQFPIGMHLSPQISPKKEQFLSTRSIRALIGLAILVSSHLLKFIELKLRMKFLVLFLV